MHFAVFDFQILKNTWKKCKNGKNPYFIFQKIEKNTFDSNFDPRLTLVPGHRLEVILPVEKI